jgi:hypothetical protein
MAPSMPPNTPDRRAIWPGDPLERDSGLGSRLARGRFVGAAGRGPGAGEESDPIGLNLTRKELIDRAAAVGRGSIDDSDRKVALGGPLGQRRLPQQLQRRHAVAARGVPQQHQQLKLGLVPRSLSAGARPVEPDGVKVFGEPLSKQTDKPVQCTPLGGSRDAVASDGTTGAYSERDGAESSDPARWFDARSNTLATDHGECPSHGKGRLCSLVPELSVSCLPVVRLPAIRALALLPACCATAEALYPSPRQRTLWRRRVQHDVVPAS